MPLTLRPYQSNDKDACLALFTSNTPLFFAPFELAEYRDFLEKNAFPYFVVENQQGEIVACGGYILEEESAILCWGMVAQKQHRQGIGTFLLNARLQQIRQNTAIGRVIIHTSQYSTGFFEQAGFVTREVLENGFAPGLHSYTMELELK